MYNQWQLAPPKPEHRPQPINSHLDGVHVPELEPSTTPMAQQTPRASQNYENTRVASNQDQGILTPIKQEMCHVAAPSQNTRANSDQSDVEMSMKASTLPISSTDQAEASQNNNDVWLSPPRLDHNVCWSGDGLGLFTAGE